MKLALRTPERWTCALASLLVCPALPAPAADGFLVEPNDPTYYELQLGSTGEAPLAAATDALPTGLAVSASPATARYRVVKKSAAGEEWEVTISGLSRRHERVDAVYQLILALPLPVDADGRDAFSALERGIVAREGQEGSAVPLIYGGEKVVLRRNVALERTLLAGIAGGGRADRMPDLAGTGYRYTLWDAVLRYDPLYGDKVTGWGSLRYATGAGVAAPDAADERLKAYLVTWIPGWEPGIHPFAVQIDVAPTGP
jgi:hypothetical protein